MIHCRKILTNPNPSIIWDLGRVYTGTQYQETFIFLFFSTEFLPYLHTEMSPISLTLGGRIIILYTKVNNSFAHWCE